jgi:excisionase family DNA binding protein
MEKHWLSVEEAAAYLGIRRDIVYKWIERKAMPARRHLSKGRKVGRG